MKKLLDFIKEAVGLTSDTMKFGEDTVNIDELIVEKKKEIRDRRKNRKKFDWSQLNIFRFSPKKTPEKKSLWDKFVDEITKE